MHAYVPHMYTVQYKCFQAWQLCRTCQYGIAIMQFSCRDTDLWLLYTESSHILPHYLPRTQVLGNNMHRVHVHMYNTHTSSSSSMGSSASKLTGAGIASTRGFFAGCGASEGNSDYIDCE